MVLPLILHFDKSKAYLQNTCLSMYLDKQHNLQFQKWNYFDYLVYHLVERAAGAKPMSFADYSVQVR
jgi:hypothetical protein